MTDDIVTRLRNRSESWEVDGVTDEFCIDAKLDREAADEIERLRAQVAWMRAVNTQMKDDLENMNRQPRKLKTIEQVVLEVKAEADANR